MRPYLLAYLLLTARAPAAATYSSASSGPWCAPRSPPGWRLGFELLVARLAVLHLALDRLEGHALAAVCRLGLGLGHLVGCGSSAGGSGVRVRLWVMAWDGLWVIAWGGLWVMAYGLGWAIAYGWGCTSAVISAICISMLYYD
eukprot:scaffold38279_cov51-Phaeocystis_antarctica.AAC.2